MEASNSTIDNSILEYSNIWTDCAEESCHKGVMDNNENSLSGERSDHRDSHRGNIDFLLLIQKLLLILQAFWKTLQHPLVRGTLLIATLYGLEELWEFCVGDFVTHIVQ
jgi:hypothetical protein